MNALPSSNGLSQRHVIPTNPRHAGCVMLLLGLIPASHIQAANIRQIIPPQFSSTGAVAAGNDLFKVQVQDPNHPNAICNDGSPAIMYVRRAANVQNLNKWVIHLKGGGSCKTYQDCLDRWTHNAPSSHFGGNVMSSDTSGAVGGGPVYVAPPGIAGLGIQNRVNPANPFRSWNHVYAYYCSSDEWSGQAHNMTVANSTGATYQIHFHGADILDAMIDRLRSGSVAYDSNGDERTDRQMPDLDTASLVLFTGNSAGANGVKTNADHLSAALKAANANLRFGAVIDAAGNPDPRVYWPAGGVCLAPNNCLSYEQFVSEDWTLSTANWLARSDDSCLAFHAPTGDQWRCADKSYLMLNHLSTPFFHRMDLQDENGIDSWITYGFGTAEDYANAIRQQLLDLSAGIYGQAVTPQVFGPICGNHVGIEANPPFFNQEIGSPNGPNYVNTLWAWTSGIYLPNTVGNWQVTRPVYCN